MIKLVFDAPLPGAVGAKKVTTPTVPVRHEVKAHPLMEGGDPLLNPSTSPNALIISTTASTTTTTTTTTTTVTTTTTNSVSASGLSASSTTTDSNRLILAAESERERNEWVDLFHAIAEGEAGPDVVRI